MDGISIVDVVGVGVGAYLLSISIVCIDIDSAT